MLHGFKPVASRNAGQAAEEKALGYLSKQGLRFVQKNYNCRMGEIDLIMHDGVYLVFVEVRSRSNPQFGGGAESITYRKKQKIMRAASYYLMTQNLQGKIPLRFDVVSIDTRLGTLSWIKDAFGVDY